MDQECDSLNSHIGYRILHSGLSYDRAKLFEVVDGRLSHRLCLRYIILKELFECLSNLYPRRNSE